ncbi:MAG: hypothetical protein ACE5Q6_05995 [Dehalococcoidia bacterium]
MATPDFESATLSERDLKNPPAPGHPQQNSFRAKAGKALVFMGTLISTSGLSLMIRETDSKAEGE